LVKHAPSVVGAVPAIAEGAEDVDAVEAPAPKKRGKAAPAE